MKRRLLLLWILICALGAFAADKREKILFGTWSGSIPTKADPIPAHIVLKADGGLELEVGAKKITGKYRVGLEVEPKWLLFLYDKSPAIRVRLMLIDDDTIRIENFVIDAEDPVAIGVTLKRTP